MRIIVTGSSGFVGTNLMIYLVKKGFTNVFSLSRSSLTKVQASDLEEVDVIIHLAGKAHDLKKVSQNADYYKINYELTKSLYDAFLVSDASKFIFISSVKASADNVTGILYETDIPNPITDYGKSKLMAEHYIQNSQLPDGKHYYILRPCMIHGPGNKGNLNLLYNFVKKGIPYPLAAFNNKRSFLSIENLCFVITALIKREIPSGIYQLADDDALSTNEVVRILASSINTKPKLWSISSRLIQALAHIGDILKLPLNTERLNKLTGDYIVSNNKIKEAIGEDMPLNVKEGLKITASSFGKLKSI